MFSRRKFAGDRSLERCDAYEQVVRSGLLFIRKETSAFQKRKRKYFKLYRKSSFGNARLEIYSATKGLSGSSYPEGVLIAGEVARINYDQANHLGIVVVLKDSTIILEADSLQNRTNWVKNLQEIFFQEANAGQNYDNEFNIQSLIKVKDNLSGQRPRASRLLTVQDGHIFLYDMAKIEMNRWSMKTIRSYGFNGSEFHFQTGRNSMYGPNKYSYKLHCQNDDKRLMKMLKEKRTSPALNENFPDIITPASPTNWLTSAHRGETEVTYSVPEIYSDPRDANLYEEIYDMPYKQRSNKNNFECPKAAIKITPNTGSDQETEGGDQKEGVIYQTSCVLPERDESSGPSSRHISTMDMSRYAKKHYGFSKLSVSETISSDDINTGSDKENIHNYSRNEICFDDIKTINDIKEIELKTDARKKTELTANDKKSGKMEGAFLKHYKGPLDESPYTMIYSRY